MGSLNRACRRFRQDRGLRAGPRLRLEELVARRLLASDLGFAPLDHSVLVDSLDESAPFQAPAGFTQQLLQSHFADSDYLNLASALTMNETSAGAQREVGRYIFATHAMAANAAVTRTDTFTGDTVVIAERPDVERLAEVVWSPWGTLLVAENIILSTHPDPAAQDDPTLVTMDTFPFEIDAFASKYSGLVYEVDPFPEDMGIAVASNFVPRPLLGGMAHRGIAVDSSGSVYLSDDLDGGSVYRFTPEKPADMSVGSLSVLRLTTTASTGRAEWIPLSDELEASVAVNARVAAREVEATTFARPAGVAYQHGILYVAITGEDRVIAVNLASASVPWISDFVTVQTIDAASSNWVGDAFQAPSALAIAADGRLFISEAWSDGTVEIERGRDIWAAVDADDVRVANEIGRFASLSTLGADPSGLYAGPNRPDSLYVAIRDSASENDHLIAFFSVPDVGFTPLPRSARLESTGAERETSAPFDLATGFFQSVIQFGTNPADPLDDPRAHSELFNRNLDMVVVNETGPEPGRYLFATHEQRRRSETDPASLGGGVSRLDLLTGEVTIISQRADYESIDGLVWTPWGTLLTGEERTRQSSFNLDPDFPAAVAGLAYEIVNPLGDPDAADERLRPRTIPRPAIGALAHEGIAFDSEGNFYVIHESSVGSLYKYVPDNPNQPDALEGGTMYALKVAHGGQGQNSDGTFQANSERLGLAEWIPLVGETTITQTLPADFNDDGVVDDLDRQILIENFGRQDATPAEGDTNGDGIVDEVDEQTLIESMGETREKMILLEDLVRTDAQHAANIVGATRYWRPEDIEIAQPAHGRETLYVALTGAARAANSGARHLHAPRVLAIELQGSQAVVRNFLTHDTIDASTGRRVGAQLQNADNLAIDDGVVYLTEDAAAGDIWIAVDADGNSQADVMGRWASLSTRGAEPSGVYINPFVPGEIFVSVQHPASDQDATVQIVRQDSLAARLAGDANFDQRVDAQDLNIVGQYWQSRVTGWRQGDFNGDLFVDAADLSAVGENWQVGVPINAGDSVPRAPLAQRIIARDGAKGFAEGQLHDDNDAEKSQADRRQVVDRSYRWQRTYRHHSPVRSAAVGHGGTEGENAVDAWMANLDAAELPRWRRQR